MTYHVTLKQYINFILENVKDDKFFMCAKFLNQLHYLCQSSRQ